MAEAEHNCAPAASASALVPELQHSDSHCSGAGDGAFVSTKWSFDQQVGSLSSCGLGK